MRGFCLDVIETQDDDYLVGEDILVALTVLFVPATRTPFIGHRHTYRHGCECDRRPY